MNLNLPTHTAYSLALKDEGASVYALQVGLNGTGVLKVAQDGVFGKQTESKVKRFQLAHGLTVDGVFGPASSHKLATKLLKRVKVSLPKGLLYGQCELESGVLIAAVNTSVRGGIDCSYVQRRLYENQYLDFEEVKVVWNPVIQFELSAKTLREQYEEFRTREHVTTDRRAWELATLHHNWPWGADFLADNGYLPDRPATWAPIPMTYTQWADFYISKVTKYVNW